LYTIGAIACRICLSFNFYRWCALTRPIIKWLMENILCLKLENGNKKMENDCDGNNKSISIFTCVFHVYAYSLTFSLKLMKDFGLFLGKGSFNEKLMNNSLMQKIWKFKDIHKSSMYKVPWEADFNRNLYNCCALTG